MRRERPARPGRPDRRRRPAGGVVPGRRGGAAALLAVDHQARAAGQVFPVAPLPGTSSRLSSRWMLAHPAKNRSNPPPVSRSWRTATSVRCDVLHQSVQASDPTVKQGGPQVLGLVAQGPPTAAARSWGKNRRTRWPYCQGILLPSSLTRARVTAVAERHQCQSDIHFYDDVDRPRHTIGLPVRASATPSTCGGFVGSARA